MSGYSGPGKLTYKSRVDTETQSLNFDFDTGNKEIKTQEKGYAGHAKGAKMVNMSWDWAIPATGPYINWIEIADAQKEIKLTVSFSTLQFVVRGTVTKSSFKSSAEGECNGSSTFIGKVISKTTIPAPAE